MAQKVLLVDDEDTILFTFESFLSDEGYEVVVASTLDDALRALHESTFDLILADILLGNRSGIELLTEIRKHDGTVPVIMMTGYPHIDTATEAVRHGAFDYLPKPVKLDTLARVVRMALQHKRLVDEKEAYRANLEAIFHSVKDAIITVDRHGGLIAANEAARSLCGLALLDPGKPLTESASRCGHGCVAAITETLATGVPVEIFRHECLTPGRQQIVSLTTSPVADLAGGSSGAMMVVRDETRLTTLERTQAARKSFHGMAGQSEAMQRVYALIENLADVQSTVLITGESGTGKELVAEALHRGGRRKDGPFIKVNCAALPENLLESELFGHERGAFTGAIRDKVGRFEMAHGGTIFLDEIGDISPALQMRLLRVLQEREFERVGGTRSIKVDVRVVAATHQDLQEKVRRGDFRMDLFYRLKVVKVPLPPLRERLDDLPLLVHTLTTRLVQKFGKRFSGVSAETLRLLERHDWPGNIRELEHVLEHAFVVSTGPVINPSDLPPDFSPLATGSRESTPGSPVLVKPKDITPEAMALALARAEGNRSKAAQLLGMSRRTFYRKLAEYGSAIGT